MLIQDGGVGCSTACEIVLFATSFGLMWNGKPALQYLGHRQKTKNAKAMIGKYKGTIFLHKPDLLEMQ